VRCRNPGRPSHQREHEQLAEDQIQLRIGPNLGDVIVEGRDIFGEDVNLAVRLEGLAEPGGLIISSQVLMLLKANSSWHLKVLGTRQVKNIVRPVRVYQLVSDLEAKIQHRETDKSPPQVEGPSTAVLLFTNMSGDSEQEYFSDGMTEDIITELSRIKRSFGIARNSTFYYKNKALDLRQIGKDIGVRYILEGSVRRAGQRLRVTA